MRALAVGVSLPGIMARKGVLPETPPLPFTPGWDLVSVVDRRDGGVRMVIAESVHLVGFEVLEQAEGGVWRGKGAAGYKKSQPPGSKGSEWMYTRLCSGVPNGNAGFKARVPMAPVAHVAARS